MVFNVYAIQKIPVMINAGHMALALCRSATTVFPKRRQTERAARLEDGGGY
jgi:hypothetical protein